MNWLAFLRTLSLALIIFTSVCYFYQILYLFLPLLLKKKPLKEATPHRYAILIAARNEEAVLPHLLESIQNQDYPQQLISVYVVADNCTDQTAETAEAHGATVFKRYDNRKIGKGYALDHLLTQIKAEGGLDRFDSFLIFDADNLLQPDYITQINKVCSAGYQAFCGFRNTKNFGTNWLTSGYGLWYIHESTHLNRSRMGIGNGCAVSGTGFGFTRELLERIGGWHFFTLTEDLEFGAWCAANGVKIGYSHDAVLYDEQPLTFCQSWRQRTRWAQGGIQVSLGYIGTLLRGLFRGGWRGRTCFEITTLSLWGFLLGILCTAVDLIYICAAFGAAAFFKGLLLCIPLSYFGAMFMAVLTLAMEWKRIKAARREKLRSVFTFPFFMMTWLPITLAAPFQKFRWEPIYHTVAITADSLQMR